MVMKKLQGRFKDLGMGGITARWYDNKSRKSRVLGLLIEYTGISSIALTSSSYIQYVRSMEYLSISYKP
jgi:hypothetical protein